MMIVDCFVVVIVVAASNLLQSKAGCGLLHDSTTPSRPEQDDLLRKKKAINKGTGIIQK